MVGHPTVYHVWLFGELSLEDQNGRMPLPSGKIQTLLTYLLLHSHISHSREHLANLLWPEAAPDRVRRQLTNLLYRFQKSLGDDVLIIEGDIISLNRGNFWVDTWEFDRLLQSKEYADLEQAITLYTGDLAPDIYEDWILPLRVRTRERFLSTLNHLAETAEKQNKLDTALAHYHHLIQFDPINETATRGLMRLYVRQGQANTAVAQYERLNEILAKELDTDPLPETHTLYKSIQAQIRPAQGRMPPPFVGRTQERTRLLSHLDQAQNGKGGLALVLGEAGMGKTRLLTEIAEAAQWRGWQIVWGHSQEFTHPPAYAPLNQAIQTACPPLRLHQLAQLVPTYWLANAIPILPHIATSLHITAPDLQRNQLAPALGHLLQGLGQISPHLILLDDVQWADPELWTLLHELRSSLMTYPVFLILNGRTDELRAQPQVWDTITAWDRANIPVLHLSGLTSTELQTLAGQRIQKAQLDHLNTASGGNPLLALTLLETDNLETPASLFTLLRRRLTSLSAPAQIALQAAAVIGRSFDYHLWQQITTAVSPTDLPLLAGELEQANMIRLEKDSYQFAHDTLHACIYTDTPNDRLRDLHQRVLTSLQQTDTPEPLRLLYHAQQAGDQIATGLYALQAGQQALASVAHKNALYYFTLALAHLPITDWHNRYQATRGRIKANAVLGEQEPQAEDTLSLLTLAEQIANPHFQAEAALLHADFLWLTGQQETAYSQAQTGLEIAQQSGDVANQAMLLVSLSRIAHNRGDYDQAIQWLQMAHDLFQQLEDDFHEADTLDKLANLTYHSGQYQHAANLHQQAAEAFQTLGNPLKEARALNGLAIAVRALGNYSQGRQIHERALSIGQELGDAELQWVQFVNLGNIAHELGDSHTAVSHYEAAIHLIRQINNPYALALTILNLSEIRLDQGEVALARQHYMEALTLNQQRGYQRGVALAQHGFGLTWLEEGNVNEAQKALKTAQSIWQELNQPLKLMETEAALALTYLAAGNSSQAKLHCLTALNLLDDSLRQTAGWRRVHYTAYQVFADMPQKSMHHLQQAGTAVQTLSQSLPPQRRQPFLEKVSLNQQIMTAVARHSQHLQVHLVRADVPLGRKLTSDDTIEITWTIHSPLDEMIANSSQRRRTILKRLLNEAAAQGAAPTDSDLAEVLNVSRRTIERDMSTLTEDESLSSTRRRQ